MNDNLTINKQERHELITAAHHLEIKEWQVEMIIDIIKTNNREEVYKFANNDDFKKVLSVIELLNKLIEVSYKPRLANHPEQSLKP